MAMPTPEQTEPITLLPEDQLTLGEAFPTLRQLRDGQLILSGHLPEDAPVFPGKFVQVSSYYMNRGDPPELGAWKITVKDTVEARLQSVPELDSGVVYSLSVKGEDNTVRSATQEEAHRLAVLVGTLHEYHPTLAEATQTTRKNENHSFMHFGKFLMAKFKGAA